MRRMQKERRFPGALPAESDLSRKADQAPFDLELDTTGKSGDCVSYLCVGGFTNSSFANVQDPSLKTAGISLTPRKTIDYLLSCRVCRRESLHFGRRFEPSLSL